MLSGAAHMLQDCNLVIYGGNYTTGGAPSSGNALYASGTYNAGVGFCSLTVTGANSGTVSIADSKGTIVFSQPPGSTPPAPSSVNTIPAGQSLAQGDRLFSSNGQYYATMQSDGNLVMCACQMPSECSLHALLSLQQGGCLILGVWHGQIYIPSEWCCVCQRNGSAITIQPLQPSDGHGMSCL